MSKNAATTKSKAGEFPMLVVFKTMDNKWHRIRCGTYTYEHKAAHEGGPVMLTLLRGTDRTDASNEPMHMMGGVVSFHINPDEEEIATLTAEPEAPSMPQMMN